MRSTLVRRIGRVAVGATAAAGLLLAPAAQAQVTAPPSVVSNVGGNGTTVSNVTLDGVTRTLVEAAPGSTVHVTADVYLPPTAYYDYQVTFGWQGSGSYAGCTGWVSGASSPPYNSTTASFDITAPSMAGIYDIAVQMGPDPCPWPYTLDALVVARVVVADYPSLCALVQTSSSDPAVANGLCDKLAAAESASLRGQVKTRDNILRAFTNQLEAQRGKALTGAQADLILLLLGEL